MEFNWKNYLATGAILACSLLGYSQDKLKTDKETSFVDSVMIESEKYPTTTHFMYEIIKDNKFNFHDVNKLEKIIDSVEGRFEKKEKYSPEEVIKILKATNKEIKNQDLKIKEHKFDCDDMSFIYLAVGEKFNLPLYGVKAPEHLFVRYDPDGKHDALIIFNPVNNEDFNWETTTSGFNSDKYYEELLNISEESIKKGSYMKNLTKKELIAYAYIKLESIESSTKAIKLDSNQVLAYGNRAILFGLIGNYDDAIKDYGKVIELDPNNSKAHYNQGNFFYDKKNYDAAIKSYDKVIEIGSGYLDDAYYNRDLANKKLGDLEKANSDLKKYEELK